MNKNDSETYYRIFRDYYETGCLCIHNGEMIKKDTKCSDKHAVEYYALHCKCSRHPDYDHKN